MTRAIVTQAEINMMKVGGKFSANKSSLENAVIADTLGRLQWLFNDLAWSKDMTLPLFGLPFYKNKFFHDSFLTTHSPIYNFTNKLKKFLYFFDHTFSNITIPNYILTQWVSNRGFIYPGLNLMDWLPWNH